MSTQQDLDNTLVEMIRAYLEPALRQRFPDKAFVFHEGDAPFASLEAPHPALGCLELHDDGDEVTIFLTKLTHGHIGCYNDDLSVEEREKRVADDVIGFLAALFTDRIVGFRIIGGFADGWRKLKDGEDPPAPSKLRDQYLWSRPISSE